jgi:hypothetical protein
MRRNDLNMRERKESSIEVKASLWQVKQAPEKPLFCQ